MKLKEFLLKVRELIQKGWTKYHFAVTQDGQGIHPSSAQACKWCLDGAIRRVGYDAGGPGPYYLDLAVDAREKLAEAIGCGSYVDDLTNWNDRESTTKEDVLEVLNHVIEQTGSGDVS